MISQQLTRRRWCSGRTRLVSSYPGPTRPQGRTPISSLILLVDDDVGVRTLLADMLEMLDHRVEMAESGEEALTLLTARSYDVVLTDFQLPGMDGAEFYRRIEEQWPHLARRVAFVTG